MTELKNCPFCGSDNLSYVLNDNEDQSIWCENCSAAGPIHIYQIEAEMAWNTRTDARNRKCRICGNPVDPAGWQRFPEDLCIECA